MTTTYFISENQLNKGPYTLADLRQAHTPPETLVWREGLTEWIPLGTLPEWAGPGTGSQPAISAKKRTYLFGNLPADWQAAALAALITASLHFIHEATPFNKTLYNLLRLVPLLIYYWGLFQVGRSFNLKGMRQAVRWLAFADALAMTGWVSGWAETTLGAVSILSGFRLVVDLWTLRSVASQRLIAVLVVTQAFDEVNIVMGLVPFFLSSLVSIVNQVCIALLFYELVARSVRPVEPPSLNTLVTA